MPGQYKIYTDVSIVQLREVYTRTHPSSVQYPCASH